MTTGTRSVGADGASAYYDYRSWSGNDGRTEISGGHLRQKWNNYWYVRTKLTGIPSVPYGIYIAIMSKDSTSAWGANEELILQNRLAEAIRGHQFNLGVALAEGKEAMQMIRSTAVSLSKAFLALRRGNFSRAVAALRLGNERHLQRRLERDYNRLDPFIYNGLPMHSKLAANDVSGRWLELQYGWLPLINDCYEAGTAFAALANPPRRTRVTVYNTKRSSYDASSSPINWSGITQLYERKRIIYELEEELSTPRSLGLMDPLSIVWEVIPFSFVVDWFIPIGTYFENLAMIPRLKGRTLTGYTAVRVGLGLGLESSTYYKKARCNRWKLTYNRTITTGLITAKPTFKKLPAALSLAHVENAMALITQSFIHR